MEGRHRNPALGIDRCPLRNHPRRRYNELNASVNVDRQILAPVKAGDKLGTVVVKLKGEVVATKDLIALKAVEKGGIFRRLYDSILMMVKRDDGE